MIKLYKDSLTILLYHGVTEHNSVGIENSSKKHISKDKFAKHMAYIKDAGFAFVSMDDVADAKSPLKNCVAVTFDDGFENNYTVAAPILESLKIPTTFYITAGIINTDLMFWVDQIEDCVNNSKTKELVLDWDGIKRRYFVSNNIQKEIALNDIKKYCKSLKCSIADKDNIIVQLIEQTKINPNTNRSPNYKKLTWSQVREMHRNDLFTIGGHSMYHNVLSKLNDKELKYDIMLSTNLINYNLNTSIKHYSYPEGLRHHFDDRVVEKLKENNIKCCPTAIPGPNTGKVDMFNLRRDMV